MELPEYLDKEAWLGFVEMRLAKGKRVPFTERAARLILKTLQQLKDAGHDPNECLDQSVKYGWSDVYEAKDRVIQRRANSEAEKTLAYLNNKKDEESSPEQRAAVAAMLQGTRDKLRRVA